MRRITARRTKTADAFVHLLSDEEDWAMQSAMAASRPLLVRGEPGIGKTQLARAAAIDLKRPLITLTVDSSTESRELLWTFDAVQRLAEAQVLSVTCKDEKLIQEKIDVKRFVRPGPIWWAFDWESAKEQLAPGDKPPATPKNWTASDGVVVLIDEIDKAESDVPNGLLDAFGSREFRPLGWNAPIVLPANRKPPLLVITTNEERALPKAFLRRCFVLDLELPDVLNGGEKEFVKQLIKKGKAHFSKATKPLLTKAATLLVESRQNAMKNQQRPLPGQAEYLDLVRAVLALVEDGDSDVDTVFQNIANFVFQKYREPRR